MKRFVLMLVFLMPPAFAGLIDDVKSRVTLQSNLRGEFRQEKRIASLNKPLISSGTFVYQQERGLLWQIAKPYESDAMITGTQLIQRVKGKTIVKVDAATQPGYSAVSRIFMALVGSDWHALEQDFAISGRVEGKNWQIDLVPKGGLFASFAKQLTLSGSSYLQKLEIAEKNGDATIYEFKNVVAAGQLSTEEEARFALR
jgi:hypothetical protein